MPQLLIVILVAIQLFLSGCFLFGDSNATKLSKTAHEMVESGAILLDVRSTQEFASGHIPGAINIPVDSLPKRVREIPRDKRVVTYCRSGRRSARAAKILKSFGYKVFDLGAMSNWKK